MPIILMKADSSVSSNFERHCANRRDKASCGVIDCAGDAALHQLS